MGRYKKPVHLKKTRKDFTLSRETSKFLMRVGNKSHYLDKAVEAARRLNIKSADQWKFVIDTRNLRPKLRV